MNPDHFLKHVIRPTISSMDMHSQAAERLLLCTAIAIWNGSNSTAAARRLASIKWNPRPSGIFITDT